MKQLTWELGGTVSCILTSLFLEKELKINVSNFAQFQFEPCKFHPAKCGLSMFCYEGFCMT